MLDRIVKRPFSRRSDPKTRPWVLESKLSGVQYAEAEIDMKCLS